MLFWEGSPVSPSLSRAPPRPGVIHAKVDVFVRGPRLISSIKDTRVSLGPVGSACLAKRTAKRRNLSPAGPLGVGSN